MDLHFLLVGSCCFIVPPRQGLSAKMQIKFDKN